MSKCEEGFVKGDSDNLPVVNSDMVNDFYIANMKFLSAEVRNVKTKRLVLKYIQFSESSSI